MNVSRKSQYVVRKLRSDTEKFLSIKALRECLAAQLGENILDVGYIEPGHGLKGKQIWLTEDDDFEDMYSRFKKHEITLWCHVQKDTATQENQQSSRKRSPANDHRETDKHTQNKRTKCAEKLSEVEKLVKKLKEKHGTKYSVEKLNIWAHMLHIEKHDSEEVPPDLPYFRGRASKSTVPEGSSNKVDAVLSPTNRVSLRTECIDQLNKWHDLLEKKIVTQEEYDQVQKNILQDIMQN